MARDVIADHDLRGRNAIVTGGASGIGVETVRALAVSGARVTVATRNASKASPVIEALRRSTGNHAIQFSMLDLASLKSVRVFVKDFLAQRRPLHLLINNAGILATPLSYTVDGFELQFGTNHLGHFLLTVGLLPALRAAGTARVIVLTSRGHRFSDIHFEDPNFRVRPYEPFSAYGQSKTANALFAVGLTQHHACNGITANAVMPGLVKTDIFKFVPRAGLIERGLISKSSTMNPNLKTPEQGAATSVWAAIAPELEGLGGLYLEDCAIAQPWLANDNPEHGYLPYALDPDGAQRLWSLSENLVKG